VIGFDHFCGGKGDWDLREVHLARFAFINL
jgi:hypothetical protein